MVHKWSYIIKAYADGYAIQFRNINSDDDWIDVIEEEGFDSPNFNLPNIEWRVKPPTLKYRIAMYFDPRDGHYYAKLHGSYTTTEETTNRSHFVEWLTDWVEYK